MDSTLIQSVVLGGVQGMSEFLPVSSTAHLVLAPYFFGWRDQGLTFDVALHIGTLLAVLTYFRNDWRDLLLSAIRKDRTPDSRYPKHFFWYLVLATIPAALLGYLFEDIVSGVLRNPLVVAAFLAVFGFILYWADRISPTDRPLGKATWKDVFLVGIAQTLALVPGVSRSGITITAGRILGFGRSDAAKISFLLSTPVIFGAALNQLPDIRSAGLSLELVIGVLASALSGYVAIAFLLKWISKTGYAVFFWYRLALACAIVIFYSLSVK
jgi:undecaprenyl-diphosphatase